MSLKTQTFIPPELMRTIVVNPGEVFALVEYNTMANQQLLLELSRIRAIDLPKARASGDQDAYMTLDMRCDTLRRMSEACAARSKELIGLYPSLDEAAEVPKE